MSPKGKNLLDSLDNLMILLLKYEVPNSPQIGAAMKEVVKARNIFKAEENKPLVPSPMIMDVKPVITSIPRKLHEAEKIAFMDEVVDMVNGDEPNA